jgi:hypothetical protein
MSRAHVHGFDTNAALFERRGDPWVSERERAEFSAPNKKERRQNRNGAKPRVADVGNFPRLPERALRVNDPIINQMKRSSRFLAAFKSGLPNGTREVAPAKPILNLDPHVRHPSMSELPSRPLTRWQQFERQCVRAKQRGEVAERCRKAAIADEKARLERQLAGIQRRLAELG